MKKNQFIIIAAFAFGIATMTACGGSSNSSEAADEQQTEETANADADAKESKKWYEQDFTMTFKQYVMGQSITRRYARKGNILVGMAEGSPTQSVSVCTDSSRTQYLVNPSKGNYVKMKEKTGYTGIDDVVKSYLKTQLGDELFGKHLNPGDEDCTAKDTTIFGRPAYVIRKEAAVKNIAVDASGYTIEWVDKANGLTYYKYVFMKNGDKVINDGITFEVSDFSTEPTYEGLTISLDGLTEVTQ